MVAPTDGLQVRSLFGGAILLQLPVRMEDISAIRPVPDHQEVWADASHDQSFLIEVVEHADDVLDDACGSYYFEDQASQNDSGASQLEGCQALSQEQVPHLPADKCVAAVHVWGCQRVSKGRQGPAAGNDVDVQLVVLRLPSVASDLLLVLNTPRVIASASQAAGTAGAGAQHMHLQARQLMADIVRSLQVVDWHLFGA